MAISGGCLCGQTRYEIAGKPEWSGSCYCSACQKESGSGHLAAIAAPSHSISVTGPTKVFTTAGGSGEPIDRTFCSECGSTMFSHPHVMGDIRIVRAGSLDDASIVQPNMQIYCGQAQPWDRPHGDVPAFDTMPPPE